MESEKPAFTPEFDLVQRALDRMASGEWDMTLRHPDPRRGISLCGPSIGQDIARLAQAAPGMFAALKECAEAKMPGEARRIARAALSKALGKDAP